MGVAVRGGDDTGAEWDALDNAVQRRDADRLRQILQGALDHAIVEMNLDGTIRGWSVGAARLLGWSNEEIVGQGIEVLFCFEDRANGEPQREMRRALAQGRADDTRWHQRRDASLFWGSGTMSLLHDVHGRPAGLLKIMRDRTTTRQAEEALLKALDASTRANAARARLITVAGHDLRQPVQVISMALEGLTGAVTDERGRKRLHLAHAALGRLGRELDVLASKAAGPEDGVGADLSTFPLQDVLSGVAPTWRHHARAKSLRLRVVDTRAQVHSDRVMLATILNNLVGNALKYTERGGVVVGCRRYPGESCVMLEVVDTGVGIEADMQETIFEPSRQLDPTRDGLGLGLSIVSRAAEVLGHRLRVASVPGRGSRFSVAVPLAR